MKPEKKDAVNMGDLICLLATVRTLNEFEMQITYIHKVSCACRNATSPLCIQINEIKRFMA